MISILEILRVIEQARTKKELAENLEKVLAKELEKEIIPYVKYIEELKNSIMGLLEFVIPLLITKGLSRKEIAKFIRKYTPWGCDSQGRVWPFLSLKETMSLIDRLAKDIEKYEE
jgi:predicted RNase H-like HicB family nuclease